MRRGPVVVAGLLALAGCAETVDVSRSEAIEVLVLDGVDRQRAICIVDQVDGTVEFAKVTGVDPDIDEDELSALASASAACASDLSVDPAPVLDPDDPNSQLEIREGGGLDDDLDERIEALITGGLDVDVAACVRSAVLGASDPRSALDDPNYVSEAVNVCGR